MNKKLLKNVAIMNVKKNKLRNLKKVFLTLSLILIASTDIQAQSMVDNGDFSGGITYRWGHRNEVLDDGGENERDNVDYTDVSGALQVDIELEPTDWFDAGIRNTMENSLNNGDVVRVKFKAQTNELNTQLKLSLNAAGTGRSDLDVDLIAGAGFRDYTFYITIDSGTDTDYKFWMHFFDAGTFKIDDIEVNVISAVSANLALVENGGTASAGALQAGTANELNDTFTTQYSGARLTVGADSWANIEWLTSQAITKVVVYAVDNVSHRFTDYTIQYWDGAAYQDVLVVSDVVSYPVTSTFATINTTKLRILATGGQYRIDEIEVYNEATVAIENIVAQEDSFIIYSKSNSIVISGKASIKQLQIFSLVGTLVYEAENSDNTGNVEIATDSLPKGIYIVRINSQYTQKIVVQ